MRRPDELRLMRLVLDRDADPLRQSLTDPHFAYLVIGMNVNRACYIFDKWMGKGWFDCGVSSRTGWLTEEGRVGLAEVLAAEGPDVVVEDVPPRQLVQAYEVHADWTMPLDPSTRRWDCEPVGADTFGELAPMAVTVEGDAFWYLHGEVNGHEGFHLVPRKEVEDG